MRRILQLILTLLTITSIFDMGLPDKSGIAGLAVEQNDGTESGLALQAPLEVETGLLEGAHVIYNSFYHQHRTCRISCSSGQRVFFYTESNQT